VSDALKPAANPAEIIKEISLLRAKEVMCFGHAPHLDVTIAQLAGARGVFTELKKAGVACFEHTSPHGRWTLLWIATPKTLRDLGD
jgi:phosphohistidine phosphatase SixA